MKEYIYEKKSGLQWRVVTFDIPREDEDDSLLGCCAV
jgi:hypothetical protein